MKRDITKLSGGEYDVLIIGGGINGAAAANLAAYNGLHTALIEKNAFASGTSSKSSKLLHGGLRYLENFEFDLVAEALKERSIQLKSAPTLTRPLGFIVPFYDNDARPAWKVRIGVWLYDLLSGKHLIYPHRCLTRDEVMLLAPGIEEKDLSGGVIYYDAQMDDKGLCLANVESAVKQQADVADQCELKGFIKENGKSVGVKVYDKVTKKYFQIKAKHIICTAGPWTNQVMRMDGGALSAKVRTTKGVHIVYNKQLCGHALLCQHNADGRVFFIIPWKGQSLVGTTDTDYQGRPDDVEVEQEDIDYLLNGAKAAFSEISFSTENITETFAGLRPLVHQAGAPSKVSRKHIIQQSYSGVIYVMGGKYTTYRKIAEDSLKFFHQKPLRNTLERYPLEV